MLGAVGNDATSPTGTDTTVVLGSDGYRALLTRPARNYVHVVLTHPHSGVNGAEEHRLTWHDVLSGLIGDASSIRNLLSDILRTMPFEAFYWECIPVSRSSSKTRFFEFVVIDAPHLAVVEADYAPFAEHLDAFRGRAVARQFRNLGGNSVLVAPAALSGISPQAYAHVANFFRITGTEQQNALWREVGYALQGRLEEVQPSNIWVSTEGSGVYWLHIRLDPLPKYYHHSEYRKVLV